MIRRPPRATRAVTLFPYTTLCRSGGLSNFAEHSAERCDIGAAHVDRLPGFSHDFDQPFSVRVRTRYPHVPVARRPVDQPGTNRVNMLYAAEIERSDVVRQCRQAIRQFPQAREG